MQSNTSCRKNYDKEAIEQMHIAHTSFNKKIMIFLTPYLILGNCSGKASFLPQRINQSIQSIFAE